MMLSMIIPIPIWLSARRWQHPAMLWPPLISIVSTGPIRNTLHPMMDRDVSWLSSLHSAGHRADWGGGGGARGGVPVLTAALYI